MLLKANCGINLGHEPIVALTKVELAAATKEEAHSKLSDMGITFSSLQWHQVAKLVLDHQHSDDSEVSRYLFDEFRRYIRRHYDVGYYDAEILIQDVNPKNAEIFKEGWMYVTAPRDKKAPLYFAPYFTRQGANSGISVISRVRDANIVVLAETETVLDAPSSEHLERWQRGLAMLRKRAEEEGFSHGEVRLLFLDQADIYWDNTIDQESLERGRHVEANPKSDTQGLHPAVR